MPTTSQTSEKINSQDSDASEVWHGMAFLSISSVWIFTEDKGEYVTHTCVAACVVHIRRCCCHSSSVFLGFFFLWNIWWKNDLLFHKVPTPSFSHKDFLSKRPLFSFQLQLQLHAWSSTCAKASAAGTMFKNRTQRLSLCSFFFIRAGLLQNEVRVDGWLDQQ